MTDPLKAKVEDYMAKNRIGSITLSRAIGVNEIKMRLWLNENNYPLDNHCRAKILELIK